MIKPESIPSDVVEKAARAAYEKHPINRRRDGRLRQTWDGLNNTFPESADLWRRQARAALAAGLEAVAERVIEEAEELRGDARFAECDEDFTRRAGGLERAARLIRFEE